MSQNVDASMAFYSVQSNEQIGVKGTFCCGDVLSNSDDWMIQGALIIISWSSSLMNIVAY